MPEGTEYCAPMPSRAIAIGASIRERHRKLANHVRIMRSLSIVLSGAAIDSRGYADIWSDVVVTTMSEFGRTSAENGSAGTDHGNASCLFMAGGAVNGGVYNCDGGSWPAGVMFGIGGRYLLQQTDYRSIFWELLRDHMGTLPGEEEIYFPGYVGQGLPAQELGLIRV